MLLDEFKIVKSRDNTESHGIIFPNSSNSLRVIFLINVALALENVPRKR